MKFLHFVALLLALAGAPITASNARAATITPLTAADRPWITLAISGLPDATSEITLQDARGGPLFSRTSDPPTHTVLFSLPLISPSDINASQWPIDITLQDASGHELEHARVSVALPPPGIHRVAVPQGDAGKIANLHWPAEHPFEFVQIPPEEILSAPAQAFAGFNALYIPGSLAGEIDEPRIAALLATGIQIIIADQAKPATSKLLWTRLDNSASPAWLCTSQAVPPLPLVLADLAQFPAQALLPAPGITHALFAVGAAAIFLALVTRALFRRPSLVLGITAGAFLMLAAAAIAYLRAADPQTQRIAHWHTQIANESTPAGGIDTETQITALQTRFGHSFDLSASYIFPLAATPHAYWQYRGIQLALATTSMTLHATLQSRQQLLLQQQSLSTSGLIPAFPATLANRTRFTESLSTRSDTAHWLIAGYIYPATANSLDTGGTLFSTWSQNQKEQPSVDAWYTLRFRADTRYFLWLDESGPHFIEFSTGS